MISKHIGGHLFRLYVLSGFYLNLWNVFFHLMDKIIKNINQILWASTHEGRL